MNTSFNSEMQLSCNVLKIESDKIDGALSCEFCLNFDRNNFKLIRGEQRENTHMAYKNNKNEFIWSHNFESLFAYDKEFSWPQMIFNVFKLDDVQKIDPCGHAVLTIPRNPGQQELKTKVFSFSQSDRTFANANSSSLTIDTTNDMYKNWLKEENNSDIYSQQFGEITVEFEIMMRKDQFKSKAFDQPHLHSKNKVIAFYEKEFEEDNY